MKYLVYGLLRDSPGPWPDGIEGDRVRLVVADRLAAACSLTTEKSTDVSRLLAYARVVETLSRGRAFLPMRYGCTLDGTTLCAFLRRRQAIFDRALRELDGCVEMGVRVLLDAISPAATTGSGPRTGAAYLAARQALYRDQDGQDADAAVVAERFRAAFSALAARCLTERPAGTRVLSLHFLIRAEDVAHFRQVFHHLPDTRRALLTGPWPLYNFAP